MGLQVAQYNVCQEINNGTFTCSGCNTSGSGDPCGNCGYGASASFTITVPYSSLIYNPIDEWVAIVGYFTFSNSNDCFEGVSFTFTINFLNQSGSSIGSQEGNIGYPSYVTSGSGYFLFAVPVPSGTDSIEVSISTFSACGGITVYVADVIFFSSPIQYYIEPLFFYNQNLTYTVTVDYTVSGYLTVYPTAGGPSGLQSYSACAGYNSGSVCANSYLLTSITEFTTFQVTGDANTSYQVTWSQQVAVPILNTSCQLSQIFVFNVAGYNNILNPSEYSFTIQTPFNGSVSKSYTLLIPVGYFKFLPSYSLTCASSPCTSGFTKFTITINVYTASGVLVASQQVDVLSGQQFVEFNLEDYYGNHTLTVDVVLDIDATLSQTVTLTIDFQYQVQAQT